MKIPAGWDLPAEIKERLGESSGRQRAMVAEGHLLLILHELPSAAALTRQGVYFWRLPEGEWRWSGGSPGYPALRKHVEGYAHALERLEQQYDAAQDAAGYFGVLEAVVPLQRAGTNMLGALQSARTSLPDAHELITIRDMAEDVDRAAFLIQTDAKNAVDFLNARLSEEQNRKSNEIAAASNRLSILAAFFLPLSVLASVFGMNLPHGLDRSGPELFWILLAVGVTVGLVLSGRLWKLAGNSTKS